MLGVAVVFPGGDIVNQRPFVGNAAAEALRGQGAEFGFAEVEPTAVLGSVVPFEALRQAARLGGRKGFVKRSLAVDIEIVLGQNDHGGRWHSNDRPALSTHEHNRPRYGGR